MRHRGNTAPPVSGRSTASEPATGSATRSGKNGNYSAADMQLVQRILRTKDYYELLEIPKSSKEDDVKKAYKKLALKLHPDKNRAPGAEEAFKKLSKVVQCLTDEEKRHIYDQYGDEDRVPQQHRGHQQDFMTPEDLFAAFFGGHVNHGHGHRQQQHHHQQGGEQQFGGAHIMQMLPVILLVMITLVGNFASPSNQSRFSFTTTHQYKNERTSAALDVTYFVTDDFGEHYAEGTQRLAEFEREVEKYYVRNLHSECDIQEKTMHKKIMLAKRRNSQEELSKARKHPRPACKELDGIKRNHASIYRMAMYMNVY